MQSKRILVTGASGLLGRQIFKTLKTRTSWTVQGTAYSRASEKLLRFDLTDLQQLPAFLSSVAPDVIIHSAAERRPDVSMRDPEGTQRLNVDATAAIAGWAGGNNAQLLYISSDYVFDGTNPPYQEDDDTHPINDYGRSKLAGERAVAAACTDHIILRVPILYGSVERLDESSVTAIAAQLLEAAPTESIKLENWAVRYPTLTDDVADIIRQLLHSVNHTHLHGIFHFSGEQAMTKYTMGMIMAECLKLDQTRLIPDNNPPKGAPRPQNSQLDTSRLNKLQIRQQTLFERSIAEILEKHQSYSQSNL